MKQLILHSALLGVLCVAPTGIQVIANDTAAEAMIQKAAVQYGNQRPYSFYYPYNYQYYTPHVRRSANSMACHWVYTNGIYVYTCK